MLSQMGFDSAPEPAPYPIGGSLVSWSALQPGSIPPTARIGGQNQMSFGTAPEAYPYLHSRKMDLNFNNVNFSATNYVPWTPAGFFTNAADRLLRSYFPTNFALMSNGVPIVTNLNINFIPIYPVNYYTPAVHRMLQASPPICMTQARTRRIISALVFNPAPNNFDYPSVFRPTFVKVGSGANTLVYINGYIEQTSALPGSTALKQPLDLRRLADLTTLQNLDVSNNNVYGVPYIVGFGRAYRISINFPWLPWCRLPALCNSRESERSSKPTYRM